MAALDHDHLVVRVVYTGPPMAGKTQSVRALMPLLKGKKTRSIVLSPGEWHGRTTFFDWADYEGGAYEGKPIRCQILSTPGQVALSSRRELLLRSADAVILVISSEADAVERAAQCYEEMAPWLAEAGRRVPIRLILQCNKQDLSGALRPEELAKTLGLPCGDDVFATSASTGKGLRAAFVAGVRRAVERAHVLVAKHLVLEPSELGTGDELFERMREEVVPFGSMPPPPASANAEWAALSGDGRSAGRATSTPARASAPASSTARSSSRASRSGLYPASASAARAASGLRSAASPSGPSARPNSAATPPGGFALPASPATSRSGSGSPHAGATSARATSSGATRARVPPNERAAVATEPMARAARRPAGSSASARAATQPELRGSRPSTSLGPATRERASVEGAEATRKARVTARAARTPDASRAPVTPKTTTPPGASAPSANVPPKSLKVARAAGSARAGVSRESEPATLARRAIVPAHAEPGVAEGLEGEIERAPPRREQGSLDPERALARAWRPGSGPRPAVMPASVYFAYMPKPAPPSPQVEPPAASADAPTAPHELYPATSPTLPSVSSSAPRARPRTPEEAGIVVAPVLRRVPGSVRPAVMPASAYFAELAALGLPPSADASARNASPTSAGASPEHVPAAGAGPAPAEAAQPAQPASDVGPRELRSTTPDAEAIHGLSAEGAAAMPPTTPDAGDEAARRHAANESGLVLRREGPWGHDESSVRCSVSATKKTTRPAVMPASAWRAWQAREGGRRPDEPGVAPLLSLLHGGTCESLAAGQSWDQRQPLTLSPGPALMPANAWPAIGSGSGGSVASEPESGSLQPAPSSTAFLDTTPAPADASSPMELAAAPDGAAANPPSSGVTLRAPLAETGEAGGLNGHPRDATASDGNVLQRRTSPTILDEPSRAFQIPETPPGLHAFITNLPPASLPAGKAGPLSAESSDVELTLATESQRAPAAPCSASAAVDIDALDAQWFSPAGPKLPGQARLQAVWRRAAWHALQTQIAAHASTLEDARGRWIGELAPGWFARTLGSAPDARAGRRAFAEEVLRERRLARHLSRPRCVVLSEEPDRLWLWQVASRVPTLATVLRASLAARPTPGIAAQALLEASLGFLDARDRFSAARVPLPLSLATLSQQDGKIVYAGLLPDPEALYAEPAGNGDPAFESSLMDAWPDVPCDGMALLEALHGAAAGKLPEPMLATIRRVVESR
jgi:signal recognition particle receptor subunit beta